MGDFVIGEQASETGAYRVWEKNRNLKMKIGLGLLTLGFALQLISNWVK